MTIETIGVVGAGVMGSGVAETLAETGHRVILLDVSAERLERARQEIRRSLRFRRLLAKGGPPAEATIGRIVTTTEYDALAEADFVIENVTERASVKEPVYRRLDAVCRPHACMAANTSAIPITRIASWTGRPSRVLGIHFMNPVPLKPMVEVIRGYHTSDETLATAKAVLTRMGKEAVVVRDAPGFVSNRVLMLTINEAIFLVQDGVAAPEDVDRIFKGCFEHKMGPLETADLIGLDTILLSIEVLYESYSDPKYRPCPLLRKMVDAGLHGRKSGRGFYRYDTGLPVAAAAEGQR